MNGLAFPDQIHLERIRADLWCGREYGRAAVMVGAGFSRNSDRLSPSVSPFPLLPELASKMYDAIYPARGPLTRAEEMRRAQATSGSGVLRLALEYEAEFGRPALDELILKAVPDDNYLPGRLHRLLLGLPWSDVFTTNYDTLLERARSQVHERKYDLIQTIHDIPGHMKPRIVKLHGSFPSHRPFIITEDDFRTYPIHFAPFVNMVQQSIMENSVCLIGFSGDDPNFLYWSGWVRDNLKEATPTIYLCGLLNISPATRKVLQSRRVIPVDLSPLFPVNLWPHSDVRHAKALEWLILNLMHGATPELKRWPESTTMVFEEPSKDLPDIPPGPKPLSGNGPHFPDPQAFKLEDFATLRRTWRENRVEYPGWIIAPKENRSSVWTFTEHWVETIFASIERIPFPENLLLLYELNWRLEVTLMPLFINHVEKITAVLEEINPFPHLIEIQGAKFRLDRKDDVELEWGEISRCWTELAFALAREAREDLDEKRFRLWMDRLKAVIPHRSELQARYFYEEGLFCLFRLDQKGLAQALQDWPQMPDLPFWECKRAALLAELGRADEAERIAEQALSVIRSRLQPYQTDYALLSQEGFVMLLLRAVSTSMRLFQETGERFRARWDKLDTFGCNPWREIELFRLALGAPQPKPTSAVENRVGFDPGKGTVTHHGSPGLHISDHRPAFALLRFCEEAGIPMRCGIVNLISEDGATAAKWILPFAPLWSLAVLLRTGQDKWIQEVYDRVRLATITPESVNAIFAMCSEGLRQSIQWVSANGDAGTNQLAHRLIPTLRELLSRLSFRLNEEQRAVVFEFGLQLYTLGVARGDYSLAERSPDLIARSAYCMTAEEVVKRIPSLLSLPILGEQGHGAQLVRLPEIWPEPFDFFDLQASRIRNRGFTAADWGAPVSRLIGLTDKGALPPVRARAAGRLGGLHKMGLLTSAQQADFAKALWSQTDPQTGLPSNTDFYEFAFLAMPEVHLGEAKRLVRSYLISGQVTRIFSRKQLDDATEQRAVINPGMSKNRFLHNLINATKPVFPKAEEEAFSIDWSPQEAATLLAKIVAWWHEEKSGLRQSTDGHWFGDAVLKQFEDMTDAMATVLLPRLGDADAAAKQQARGLLSEMEQYGLCVLSALPASLFIAPQDAEEAASKIRTGLISHSESDSREAMSGLFLWLAYSQKGQVPAPPDDLLATLVNKVTTRTQPALLNAIGRMSAILKRVPSVLNERHIVDLSIGLDYLRTETKIPNVLGSEESDTGRLIPIAKLPLFRKYASALAADINAWCMNKGKPVPAPILKWKEDSKADVLPEVRFEWEPNPEAKG